MAYPVSKVQWQMGQRTALALTAACQAWCAASFLSSAAWFAPLAASKAALASAAFPAAASSRAVTSAACRVHPEPRSV